MSLLELEDRQGYLVTQATDMHKRFNSLTLLLLARFHLNANSGQNWVLCLNKRRKLMRLMTRSGSQQIECNCRLIQGTYSYLIASRTNQAYLSLTAEETQAFKDTILSWLELSNARIFLVLQPVDMRKRYSSLALHYLAKYHLNVNSSAEQIWVASLNRRGKLLRLIGRCGNQMVEVNSVLTQGSRNSLTKPLRTQFASQSFCSLSLGELKLMLSGRAVPLK